MLSKRQEHCFANTLLIDAVRHAIKRRQTAEAQDPARLAERLGLALDPWQLEMVRSDAPKVVLNCCRQSGKSMTVALAAVHTAIYKPGSLILILSPSLRQSTETFRKCLDFYRTLAGEVPADSETLMRLELRNGSRLLSLPGLEKNVRGYSKVTLLLVDEAARVADELFYSVRPMLAVSRGRMVVLSTPFGRRGFFHEVWEKGEGWQRFEVKAADCPRIPGAFLDEEKRSMPDLFFRSEYLCEFVDVDDAVFRSEDIEAMFDPTSPTEGWWSDE